MAKSRSKTYLSMQEFVALAVEFEEFSADLYRRMREVAADASSAELLKKLEADELEHKRVLSEFTGYENTDQRLQFGPELEKSMPPVPSDADFASLLEFAIDREKKSFELYKWTAGLVKGAFKDLLDGLARFEKVHEINLKKLR